MNEDGELETWEYKKEGFEEIKNWLQIGSAKICELDNCNYNINGLYKNFTTTPNIVNTFEYDISIKAGKQFDIISDMGVGDKNIALNTMYEGVSGWQNDYSIKNNTLTTLTVGEKNITKIRLYQSAQNVTEVYSGYVKISFGIGRELPKLQEEVLLLKQQSEKISQLEETVSNLETGTALLKENVEDLSDNLDSINGAEAETVRVREEDWEQGFWKQDLSYGTNAGWLRTKIRLKNSNAKLKYTITNNPNTYFILTDENDSVLFSKNGLTAVDGEMDISIYPKAKYAYVSTQEIESYYVEVQYRAVKGLDDKVSELEETVSNLEISGGISNYPDTSKMKVLVIGDSISTGPSCVKVDSKFSNYGNYDKWVDNLISWGFFKDENVVNNSLHASGFVAENPNTELSIGEESYKNSFLDRTKYLVDSGKIDLGTFDLIIVFGGINDFKDTSIEMGTSGNGDTTKIIPALEEFYDYLWDNAVQARICVILPTRISMGDTMRGVTIWEFCDAIKTVIKKYSFPYLDLTSQSGFAPGGIYGAEFRAMWTRDFDNTGAGDGVHPNAAYNLKYLAPQIMRFIRGLISLLSGEILP